MTNIPSTIHVDCFAGITIAISGTNSIPIPGSPVLLMPTITAHDATTTQPNKFNSIIA